MVAESRQSTSEGHGPGTATPPVWRDARRGIDERVDALLDELTLEEKLAQLGSVWLGRDEADQSMAPSPDQLVDAPEQGLTHGIGHLTRVLGTRPVEPLEGARRLADLQRALATRTRLGIPAIAHEECLTGFTTYRATVFPTPLLWAATFDPDLVETMARAIGAGMRAVGVHQGLSPVLDVVRDYRWGRVEETMGEDPYLVSMVGTAYVRGLQSAGVLATLKHFAGHAGSEAGRNHAPVHIGPRELADVALPPFEMAVRDGRAGSVMNSYTEQDGVPAAADRHLLTAVLRDEWRFTGTVVSDYWAIGYLQTRHRVAGSPAEAAALALRAGIDVELPQTACYGRPLAEAVRAGDVPIALVDRAVRRVLRQKVELGLLDPQWSPEAVTDATVDLDPPGNRVIARQLAERGIVLLHNRAAVLPLRSPAASPPTAPRRVAVVGPCADDVTTYFGCYSFPNHVLAMHPGHGVGIEAESFADALRAELPECAVAVEPGCAVRGTDRSGIQAAVTAARAADVCIAVVGDRAGMFGLGTSGEGCDAPDLRLPGVQPDLLEAVLAAGTPVVLVVVSGRPYAIGEYAERAAAALQVFFPGVMGGPALAGVLSGRIAPSGRLPVQIPGSAGGQPGTYLHPPLGGAVGDTSSVDPAPAFPFGHGLSYTTFEYTDLTLSETQIGTDGSAEVSLLVRNTGQVPGTEVVQLYLTDPVAQVTRPVRALAGFARVPLDAGERARVAFRLHADRTSFTGIDLTRVVEPGDIEVVLGASSVDIRLRATLRLNGPARRVGHDRVMDTPATVTRMGRTPAS